MIHEPSPLHDVHLLSKDQLKSRIGELEEEANDHHIAIDDLTEQIEELKEDLTEAKQEIQQLQELQLFVPHLVSELEAYLEHLKTEYQTDHIREVVDRTSLYSLKEIIRKLTNA